MRMREARGAILVALAALAACSPATDEEASPESGAQAAVPAAEQPDADAEEAGPGTSLPPSGATFRYIGRWAESVEQCRSEAWTFTSNRLTAPDDIACDFAQIEKSPGGYTIDATCMIEGEEEDNNITLRFAESAQAMLVEGATSLPETGLVYCEADRGAAS